MKKIQHRIEYIALIVFAACLRLLPLSWARFFARRLADFAYYFVPIRKKIVLKNLADSFKDEKSPSELRRIAKGTYRQFAQTIIELIFFPKLTKEDIKNMVSIEGRDALDAALKGGKGGVLVAAHFGNWELIGPAVAQEYPLSFIIGQQSNELTDDLLNSYRAMQGMRMIPMKVSLRGVTRVLKDNEFIALVSDQDAHEKGTFVDFFGRPASTPKGPALFALRFGAPIIASMMIREKGHFRAVFEEVPRPALTGDEEKDIQNYTAAYTKVLEKYIRMYPDHWFWMHKRWKTRPS